jgi:biopolymer transport protein ExbB/TolQ
MNTLLGPDQNLHWTKDERFLSLSRMAQGLVATFLFVYLAAKLSYLFPLSLLFQAALAIWIGMWALAVRLSIKLFVRYCSAHREARTFVRKFATISKTYDLPQAIALAENHRKCPVARVYVSGLRCFYASLFQLTDKELIEVTQRALRRSADIVQGELRGGLGILASISVTAPLTGVFITWMGIMAFVFFGAGMEKSTLRAMESEGLAKALLPTALGLLMGLQSLWCYKHLASRLERLDLQTKNESVRLLNYLTRYIEQRNP